MGFRVYGRSEHLEDEPLGERDTRRGPETPKPSSK